jgi:hypothetical protein
VRGALRLTIRASPHQLEQVVIDVEPRATSHLADDGLDVLRSGKFDDLLTTTTDNVVAVAEIGPGVSVTVVILVDTADAPQVCQQGQRAIDRHQSDPRAQGLGVALDLFWFE